MEDVMLNNINKYQEAFGGSFYIALFFVSLIYIMLYVKEKKKRDFLLGFAILFSFIYWCPLTSYVITYYCIGKSVVWRMFWILPTTAYIAYAAVGFLGIAKMRKKQVLFAGVLVAMLLLNGTTIYTEENFQKADNPYKLSPVAMEIADVIKADAESKWIENRGVIVPDDLVEEIKQYDGKLRMPYGRDMLRNLDKNEQALEIYYMINHLFKYEDICYLKSIALREEYHYLVCFTGMDSVVMQQAGYYYVDTVEEYDIFCIIE